MSRIHLDRRILTWRTQKYPNPDCRLFSAEETALLLWLQSYDTRGKRRIRIFWIVGISRFFGIFEIRLGFLGL